MDVIFPTIFAVGWDKQFIIAKQHPADTQDHPDKRITNFFILRVSDGALVGPLDESSFEAERIKHGVAKELGFVSVDYLVRKRERPTDKA